MPPDATVLRARHRITMSRRRAHLRAGLRLAAVLALLAAIHPSETAAQALTQRGFVEGRATIYPQDAANDDRNVVGDLRLREEVFFKPIEWLQLAGGIDVLANSYHQVDPSWTVDFGDRGVRRPRISVRRLSATLTRGPLTIDIGKQFIRWGKADIVTPTDRFAPRDFLNVIDSTFLPVRGVRVAFGSTANTVEGVVVPYFTPSRAPLLDQRWTVPPPGVELSASPVGRVLPGGSQFGVRWSHVGGGYEHSVSFFDGYNNLPYIIAAAPIPSVSAVPAPGPVPVTLTSLYPRMRMYGADAAIPTRWMTVKAESGYFVGITPGTDDYVLYVVQLERQTGEWLLVGGYAGEVVTRSRGGLTFAPDRGTARSFLGRASYTIDPNRSAAIEAAVRQDGGGLYVKGEFSRASGPHWRTTLVGALIRGEPDDFIGQYRLNSHVAITLRYSF